MKKILLFITSILVFSNSGYTQLNPMVSDYLFNVMQLNPAYTGTHNCFGATMVTKNEMLGMPGAPATQTLSLHSPILKRGISLGAIILNDKIGVMRRTEFQVTYGYRLKMGHNILAFGLNTSYITRGHDYAALKNIDTTDPTFNQSLKGHSLRFGTGVYFYNNRFSIGVSTPSVVNELALNDSHINHSSRQMFVTGGYSIVLNRKLVFEPNMLVRIAEGTSPYLGLNFNAIWKKRIALGVGTGAFHTYELMTSFFPFRNFQMGYVYGYKLEIQGAPSTHEIMISYKFRDDKFRVTSPRLFR